MGCAPSAAPASAARPATAWRRSGRRARWRARRAGGAAAGALRNRAGDRASHIGDHRHWSLPWTRLHRRCCRAARAPGAVQVSSGAGPSISLSTQPQDWHDDGLECLCLSNTCPSAVQAPLTGQPSLDAADPHKRMSKTCWAGRKRLGQVRLVGAGVHRCFKSRHIWQARAAGWCSAEP